MILIRHANNAISMGLMTEEVCSAIKPDHRQILQFLKIRGTLHLKGPNSDDNDYYNDDNDNNHHNNHHHHHHHHHNLIFISCRLHINILIHALTSLNSKTNL